ncbi:MAG: M20/M25/M40 family metallo-hydrolase [Anaerolineae bacterium]|nr:M28 family metallopeptidase [Candidatus Roseilinea sp.]MDW8450420.1 M20/M25/M40 family metallo-hydrolase [Anaerolineae bacterium]
MSLLGHIHHLSEDIGPRGSATEGETKASDYVQRCLRELGLQPERQPVLSATSSYAPFIIATGATLLGMLLFWQPQPVGAAAAFVLATTAFGAVLRELTFNDNPLRWVIPTGRSQNVLATLPAVAQDEKRPPILITAHVDTHRTPLLFSSPAWRRVFRVIMPAGLGCIAALAVIFAVGIFSPARALRELALAPGAVVAAIFLLMIQAATSPFTQGANDNASGVAVALDLAAKLVQRPLQHRDVIVAFTACEEVGAYGAEVLIRAQRHKLRGAVHLVIDHVGGLQGRDFGPSIIRSEKFLRRVECDPHLVQVAQRIAGERPELCATVRDFDLAYSELSIGAKYGLRTIGLIGLTPEGDLPNWHTPHDVIGNLNAATLERTAAFAWHLLQAIDAEDAA